MENRREHKVPFLFVYIKYFLYVCKKFENDLYTKGSVPVMISANAVNGMKAGLGSQYLTSILNDYSTDLRNKNGIATNLSGIPRFKIMPEYNSLQLAVDALPPLD